MRPLNRILVLAAVLLACSAAPAHAGTYTVETCRGAGPFDGWSYAGSHYVGAYADCSVHSNSGAPGLSAGQAVFTAPPGAAIVGIGGEFNANQQGGWQVGIYDFSAGAWRYCGPSGACQTFGSWYGFNAGVFRTDRIGILQVCGANPCNGPASYAVRSVNVTIEDSSPPNLAVNVPGGWVRGTQTIGIDARDNVGVRTTRVLVDGKRGAESGRSCDAQRAVPCPNGGGSLTVSSSELADGPHTVTTQAVDSANNVASLERPLLVDNTAPGQVGELVVQGGDRWRSSNSFDLTWQQPPQPGVAPISAVEYELCPVGASRGASACRRSARPASEFAGDRNTGLLKDVEVPAAGEWTASIWLRDEAGNHNPETAKTATLRFDDAPPVSAFRQLDPADPTSVRVVSSDGPSGIDVAAIEIQRQGDASWRALDVRLEEGGFAASLDDVSLPDGRYALRARAIDRAGNERSTTSFEGGQPAEVALPVRIKTRLAVGKPKRIRTRKGKHRTTLVSRPEVGYGSAVRLQGRLTTPGANALPGTELQVFEQVKIPGSAPRPIGTVTTSRTGRFSFRIAKGPSRIIAFRYGGTKTIRADVGEVDLRVRSSTSFAVSRRSVVNGQAVTFSGRLRGGNIPAEGKLVALQALSRGRWRPFATTRANPRSGRWSYTYRFDGTRGKVRYRFRARVLREATYPFATGTSGRQRVTVRGI